LALLYPIIFVRYKEGPQATSFARFQLRLIAGRQRQRLKESNMRNARIPAAETTALCQTTRSEILDILSLAGLGTNASTAWLIERMLTGLEAGQ
jgi:hypothetical protein